MSEQPVFAEQSPGKSMSFLQKAAGVFYKPSEVFDFVKTSGIKFIDWFIPLLLVLVVAAVTSFVELNVPSLRLQIVQQREAAIEKAEAQGRISTQQADQQRQMIVDNVGTGSAFAVTVRILTVTVVLLITFFIVALVWFLVGRFPLNSPFDFTKAVAITGLSNSVVGIGLIVALVISVFTSRLDGGLQLGMLVKMSDQSTAYAVLSKINLFTIWSLMVVSAGLGIFTGKKKMRAGVWVFGIWILWEVICILFSRIAFS